MQKKIGQHRRYHQTIQKIIPIIGVFIITLLCLFLAKFISRSHSLISPIGKAYSSIVSMISNQYANEKEIQKGLSTQNITVRAITQTGTDISVTTDKNVIYIFDKKKKIPEQITSLQLILTRLTIEGKQANKIDFRFNNPVVTF